MNNSQDINKLVKKISQTLKVEKIILFGSHAYGKTNEDSDIDLCVITNVNKRKLDIRIMIRKALIPIYTRLDILVYNEQEFKERSELQTTLEYKIVNEGLIVYG